MSGGIEPSIPYGRQSINEEDIAAVAAILRSDFLTQGPAIERFEKSVARYCGAHYAVAVANATAALHLGALALGLRGDDELWTSPNTFVASANCAIYCGAGIDFVDVDCRTYNVSVDALDRKLQDAQSAGRLPKVLVPVHFAGQPCEMEPIARLCRLYGVRVMEDASHAIGAEYQNNRIGSCVHSDLTVFSFHPVKIMTTGEGGMLLTNDKTLYDHIRRLRGHGITRDAERMSRPADGPWYYEQVELGWNYRLTDIQSALGLSQLTRLPLFLERRRALAARYNVLLADLPLVLPWQHPDCNSSWHLYVVLLDRSRTVLTRSALYDGLRAAHILAQVHYIPVHTQPYFEALGFRVGDFPNAEEYYKDALSLPIYFDLSEDEQDRVVATIRSLFYQ